MVCQYSTRGLVSREKDAMMSGAGVEGRGGDTSGVAFGTEVMGAYCPLLDSYAVVSGAARGAKMLQSRTPARLHLHDTLPSACRKRSKTWQPGVAGPAEWSAG
jgi:hypothetical protein